MQHPHHIHFTNDATGLRKTSPGNTRLIPAFGTGQVFADKNGNGIIEVTNDPATCEIIQENHYYPFGLNHEGPWLMNDAARDNPYKFNGIERHEDFGLNWDIAVFRSYDTATGRWGQVDPRPGFHINPYSGFGNNPVLLRDALGDTTRIYSIEGQYLFTINDSRPNEDHFIKSGNQIRQILNRSARNTEAAAQAARNASVYYIGANTRSQLQKIVSVSEKEGKERGFVLGLGNSSKELQVFDISGSVSLRNSNRFGIGASEVSKAIYSFSGENPGVIVIGFGHTHPSAGDSPSLTSDLVDARTTPSSTNDPSNPKDFHHLWITNHLTGALGHNPSIIASEFGFRVYRTFKSQLDATGSTRMSPTYDFTQPVINFSGTKIRD